MSVLYSELLTWVFDIDCSLISDGTNVQVVWSMYKDETSPRKFTISENYNWKFHKKAMEPERIELAAHTCKSYIR